MNKVAQRKGKLFCLYLAPNKFPPRHVDVSILFGKEIVSYGHSVDFLLQSKDPCNKSYQTKWNNMRVYVGATDAGKRLFNRGRKRFFDLLNNLKAFSLIRRERYDFIQVKDRFISAVIVMIAAKKYKVKYFYWLSYPFPEANLFNVREGFSRYPIIHLFRGYLYKFLLYRIILPNADHIFVQSDQMKKDIRAQGIDERKLTPVPMGVLLESVPYDPSSAPLDKDMQGEKSIVYLGTMIRTRKMDFLIKVFSKVTQKEPNTRLYMVGEGDDPEDLTVLKDLSSELGVAKQVTFTGFLPMHEAWNYVRHAVVCVSPFYTTPILCSTSPTKLIEYMAMGKPVVANDHPEQRKIIQESGGGLCVPYEVDAFSDAIVEILRNPKQAFLMGRRGRKYVEHNRSYDKIGRMLEQSYFSLCYKEE